MNFLKKILSPTCLAISSLLLIYTFYRSEIYWNGDKRYYYNIYYIISSLLICFSIITFFMSQKIKEYLIILIMSLIMSLYLLEGYLTIKKRPLKEQISKEQLLKEQLYEKQTGYKWDRRTKFQIYQDLKKNDNEVAVSVYPSIYKKENNSIFPLSGISNFKTINCNENGYYSIYQSDRYGFNNPDEEWDSMEIEYLLVGDSFTHGACVNRPNDIASVLRDLSNKSVLNLGYGKNGPLIKYATLREYLNSNVKKVFWIYFAGNDLMDLTHEVDNKILMSYLDNLTFTQNLKSKQNEINNLAINLIENSKILFQREKEKERIRKINDSFTLKFVKFIKIYNLRELMNLTAQDLEPVPEPTLKPTSKLTLKPEFRRIIKLAKDLTIRNNSKLYFVYLPKYSDYKTNYDDPNYNLIKNIVNELKIPFIAIHKKVFEKEQNPSKFYPFGLPGHFNVEGYKKVAETIYKFSKK